MPSLNSKSTPVGRLAPSPTGAQHLGNARSFLLAWLSIRAQSGWLILRIEDIDSPRTKSGADQQAIDDLKWLGLDWDEGPQKPGPVAPYYQTEKTQRYHAALKDLQDSDLVYACTCSRSDIAQAASAPHAGAEGPIYPGTCAGENASKGVQLAGPSAWRYRWTDASMQFKDGLMGRQQCNPSTDFGDFVVFKADTTPAYQLAVVVDDHEMQVTEVLRGNDLIPSTFRQLALYRAFGWKPPTMIHVPLVVGTDGRRLAKRHGDTRLSSIRQAGVAAEQVVGYLAYSSGLIDRPESVSAHELLPHWNLECVTEDPWTWDEAILNHWTAISSKRS